MYVAPGKQPARAPAVPTEIGAALRQPHGFESHQFIDAFAGASPETLKVIVLDTSRCHSAKNLRIPDNLRFAFLPPIVQNAIR